VYCLLHCWSAVLLVTWQAAEHTAAAAGRQHMRSQTVTDADIAKVISKVRRSWLYPEGSLHHHALSCVCTITSQQLLSAVCSLWLFVSLCI
jgi:hypothetical protein